MSNLGSQMKDLRIARHWTQQQLENASGVHCNTIINFENNKSSPTDETLSLLLEAMGYKLVVEPNS